jgi:hypothetical protein
LLPASARVVDINLYESLRGFDDVGQKYSTSVFGSKDGKYRVCSNAHTDMRQCSRDGQE